MAEQAKVPAIRFAGFTDPWEQRKLGEVAPLQRGFDLPVNQMTPGPYPVVMSNGIGGWHSKYMVKGPGVVTGRSGTIGSLHYIEQNFWPHNTSLWVTSFNGNEPRFIYWLYASIGLERFGSGSGVPTLNRNDVHDLRVGFPCDVAEQRRIGTFFSRLDSLITLHQRKYDKLVIFKKSMLEKMFPKDGESVPEIRFAGFTDPWEQRKLGEFGSVAMCKRIYKEQTSEQGDVPFFKIGTFGADPDAFISNELFEDCKRTYPYPTPGTLLISAAGSIGRIVEYQGEKAYFQDSNIVWLEHDHRLNDAFLKPLYSKIEWGLEGSTIKRLYNKDLLSAEVTIPDGREQKEIGQFFAKLDSLITLHQRKLELLRNIKKSLLDKMFV
ncbi:restriction endonuclease subunit S [Bifidobacterium bifidum]|uniref:restriction endonuclease subunit S n=1 Tax=Bifidobacterium bifidum TaxID=1681 RepID=UPI00065894C8|nr:restriction endonuclease subunit S [Bifidobacterium bifidum]KLN81399.1 type I restriction-modification system, subunit S [Bifidobacterium bifidum]